MILLVLLASACAHTGRDDAAPVMDGVDYCGEKLDADTAMRLDLIETLMREGRLHAGLAHLDNLGSDALRARYLRAEMLRQSGRHEEASGYYHGLLGTCMAGHGHHGLGLIAGRSDRLDEALNQLQTAVRALPVNARLRNDFGYALLLDGQYERARREFLTALELDEPADLAQSNMVLLLFVSGEAGRAEAFADRAGIDREALALLRRQANELMAKHQGGQR